MTSAIELKRVPGSRSRLPKVDERHASTAYIGQRPYSSPLKSVDHSIVIGAEQPFPRLSLRPWSLPARLSPTDSRSARRFCVRERFIPVTVERWAEQGMHASMTMCLFALMEIGGLCNTLWLPGGTWYASLPQSTRKTPWPARRYRSL